MSVEQLKAFLDKAQSDVLIQGKLKDAKCENCVVEIAAESGFHFAAEAIDRVGLSMNDFLDIVGGKRVPIVPFVDSGLEV